MQKQNNIESLLNTTFPHEVISVMIKNYINALGEYRKENWQYFGSEIGQFIECARRMIEFIITGTYTSLKDKFKTTYDEQLLLQWLNASPNICEEYRIIIPRVLYSMYCIRNKRGVVHKNHIDPNRMDATLLLYNSKWILAEFVRLNSTLSFNETFKLVESIMNKETSAIWNVGSLRRILDTKMSCSDKVLCLLYIENNQTVDKLLNSIEYSNPYTFRDVLKRLHKSRMLEYSESKISDGLSFCAISPLGEKRAEELLK